MNEKEAREILSKLAEIEEMLKDLKSKIQWLHNDLREVKASLGQS